MFSILIIGKGLVGSAAARYLSQQQEAVGIIGPDEPEGETPALVYASHYDEARVQRLIGWDRAWTRLNLDAVAAYARLEEETGISFHRPVGCLYVTPYGEDAYLRLAREQATEFRIDPVFFTSGNTLNSAFPDFHFPEGSAGMYESGPAGHINPRKLLRAQLKAAAAQGATVISDTVTAVHKTSSGYQVNTLAGKTHTAEKLLLATGSFLNQLNLAPRKLALKSKSEVVLLVKLDAVWQERLSQLPSLLYEINEPEAEGVYVLPPVPYPDGNTYLKIGSNLPEDRWFDSLESIQEWFRNGNSEQSAPRLIQTLKQIMPELPIQEFLTKRCIVSYTPNKRPLLCGSGEPGIYIAGGCNGYSAMCSDAMGKTAAALLLEGKQDPAFALQVIQ